MEDFRGALCQVLGRRTVLTLLAGGVSTACIHSGVAGGNRRAEAVAAGLLERTRLEGEEPKTFPIEERMRFYGCSGAQIALIDGGRIVWLGNYGVTRAEGAEAVRADTLFQPGSIGKTVTALAALRLVEQGLLALDEDINARLTSYRLPVNEFTRARPVTLRMLLNHTAATNLQPIIGYPPGAPLPTTLQTLRGEAPSMYPPLDAVAEPGAAWSYSGGGYILISQLMEDVTGLSFRRLTRDLVLDPLGMNASTFDLIEPNTRRNIALGHRADGSTMPEGWLQLPESGVGGWWSCAEDIAKLALAIEAAANGERRALIAQNTALAMLTPGLGNWGLGVQINDTGGVVRFQHNGGTEGYRATMLFFRGAAKGIVVLTNSDIGDQFFNEVIRAAAVEYDWGVYPQRVRAAITMPDNAEALVGQYRLTADRRSAVMTIEPDGAGGLQCTIPIWGGWARPRTMHAASPDVYFFREHAAEIHVVQRPSGPPDVRVENVLTNLIAARL